MKNCKIEKLLSEIGFEIGSLNEAIVTTINSDHIPNAAPMGVKRLDALNLEIRPFKTSSTHKNLLKIPKACINISSNPAFFLVTTFKKEHFNGLREVSIDENLRIDSSDAHVFVKIISSKDFSKFRARFICQPTSFERKKVFPKIFNRGKSEAIEAIIIVSRIQVFAKEKKIEKVEDLIRKFKLCKNVVSKVSAPESVEFRVIESLENLISSWREKS